ncbi:MAG: aspartate-semialdehyde dehydrogenase [Proteobacteria bacterium]|jgi:aspartate-semialdehyde dehydrogenase|nr:aspartate-semialdehyde dehydrogenase [Pseudomonadota bacterium]
MRTMNVAVVGATGAVGRTMLDVLAQRGFPVGAVHAVASERSRDKRVAFAGRELAVEPLPTFDFSGVDVALFSAGGSTSLAHAPRAAAAGAVVVDNTSAFRRDADVPLVVPEVNPGDVADRPRGIIANPNCSTIQMVVALAPLHAHARIRRIVVATYQSVSGAGTRAMDELRRTSIDALDGKAVVAGPVFPHPIAFNCLPQIDVFEDDGYTKEEHKMMFETRKIFHDPSIRVSATCVRVPVLVGHAEAVNVELEGPISPEEARALLAGAPGVELVDAPAERRYPMQSLCAGRDPVLVGRIRRDPSRENALDLWIAADNLRKGAALNAVQIAEILLAEGR